MILAVGRKLRALTRRRFLRSPKRARVAFADVAVDIEWQVKAGLMQGLSTDVERWFRSPLVGEWPETRATMMSRIAPAATQQYVSAGLLLDSNLLEDSGVPVSAGALVRASMLNAAKAICVARDIRVPNHGPLTLHVLRNDLKNAIGVQRWSTDLGHGERPIPSSTFDEFRAELQECEESLAEAGWQKKSGRGTDTTIVEEAIKAVFKADDGRRVAAAEGWKYLCAYAHSDEACALSVLMSVYACNSKDEVTIRELEIVRRTFELVGEMLAQLSSDLATAPLRLMRDRVRLAIEQRTHPGEVA